MPPFPVPEGSGLCSTGWILQIPVPVSQLKGGAVLLLLELQGAQLTMAVTRRAQALLVTPQELGWAGLAGICSPAFPRSWELPSHSPELLWGHGAGQGHQESPWVLPSSGKGSVLIQTPPCSSPVFIQDFVFPGCEERQMSVCLGLAGRLFVLEIPNWAELSSAWAQLREGSWGSPLGTRLGAAVLPVSSWGPSLGLREMKAQWPRVPSRELRTLMAPAEPLQGSSPPGLVGPCCTLVREQSYVCF